MANDLVTTDEAAVLSDASERLRMPYGRLLVPEAEGGYRGEILEFPGCVAEGDDAVEALSELEDAAESWIEAAMEMGSPIPQPFEELNFSGRLNVRLSKSLHRRAALAAQRDGVSLNQFIVTSIAEAVGQKATTNGWNASILCSFHVLPSVPAQTTTLTNLSWAPQPIWTTAIQGPHHGDR